MIHATLPKNRLALGIFAVNVVNDGDDFRDDGYVYQGGKRVRKWFVSRGRGSKYFWEPCLNDIAHLETVLFRLKSRGDSYWKEAQRLFAQAKKVVKPKHEAWVFHVRPPKSHCEYVGNETGWLQIRCNEDRFFSGLSYSWRWLDDEAPTKPLHVKWGQKFYEIFRKAETQFIRASLVRSYLLEAIQRDIQKKHPGAKLELRIFKYTINGREYWLREESTRFGGRELNFLADPGGYVSETI